MSPEPPASFPKILVGVPTAQSVPKNHVGVPTTPSTPKNHVGVPTGWPVRVGSGLLCALLAAAVLAFPDMLEARGERDEIQGLQSEPVETGDEHRPLTSPEESPSTADRPPGPAAEGVVEGPSLYGPREFRYDENYFGLDTEGKERLVDRIQWRLTFWTSYSYFNNSDLRSINEDNETSIEQTDDRTSFFIGGAAADFFFPINPWLDFRLDLWKSGFWGHDQLGGRDANNDSRQTPSGANTVNFGMLFMDIHLIPEPTRVDRADLTLGRQKYGLGGYIYQDYLLDDTLDAIVFRWYGWLGRLDLLVVDVYSTGSDTEDVNFVQYLSHDSEKIEGFDGDVNTYRHGLTYRLPLIGDFDLGGSHLKPGHSIIWQSTAARTMAVPIVRTMAPAETSPTMTFPSCVDFV